MPSLPRRSTAASRCRATGGAPKGLQSTGNSAVRGAELAARHPGADPAAVRDRRHAARPAGARLLQRGCRAPSPLVGLAARSAAAREALDGRPHPPETARRARTLSRRRAGATRAAIPICTSTCWRWRAKACWSSSTSRSTKTPRCIRWCAGSIAAASPEPERKAFLFTQPTDSKGRRYDTAVLVAGLAANRAVYRIGFGKPLEDIGAAWVNAIANPIPPRVVENAPCQEIVITGADLDKRRPGARRPAGADLDAGLGQRALSLRRPLHHQGSRHRRAERRQLPRPAQGAAAPRHEPVGRAARRHLRALGEIQGARRAAALRGRGRLPAGRLLRVGAEARQRSRRARGRGRASPAGRSMSCAARPSTCWCRRKPRS